MVTWHPTMKLFPAKWHERAQHGENYDVKYGKQFTVPPEMLTAVARDRVPCCCRWNLSAFFNICFCFLLLFSKSINDWSLGEQWILFPSNLNVSLVFVSWNVDILGKQNSVFPLGPVIKYWLLYGSVSQGLGTTKFTNLIGWIGYWPRSRFSHLDRHLDR